MIKERLGLEVSFGTGCIVYKETIAEPVEEATETVESTETVETTEALE